MLASPATSLLFRRLRPSSLVDDVPLVVGDVNGDEDGCGFNGLKGKSGTKWESEICNLI